MWLLSEIEDILRFEVVLGSFWFVEIFELALSHINMIGRGKCFEGKFKLRVLAFLGLKILIVCFVVIIEGLGVRDWLVIVDLSFFFQSLSKAESFGGLFGFEGILEIVDEMRLVFLLIL